MNERLISEAGLWGWLWDYRCVVFETFRDDNGDLCYSCTLGARNGVKITAPTLEGLLREVWDYVVKRRGGTR